MVVEKIISVEQSSVSFREALLVFRHASLVGGDGLS